MESGHQTPILISWQDLTAAQAAYRMPIQQGLLQQLAACKRQK
jgi:hypothetical protein